MPRSPHCSNVARPPQKRPFLERLMPMDKNCPAPFALALAFILCAGCGDDDANGASGSAVDVEVNPHAASVIFYNTFDDAPAGSYTASSFADDWGNVWNAGIAEGRADIVEGGDALSGKSLRVRYPKGGYDLAGSGVGWAKSLSSHDELYCSYAIRFSDDFEFVKGGKLPGLAGGAGNTGGDKPTGSDGWSARMMWRSGGALVQYVYHPDQPTIYGEDFPWAAAAVTPGVWYRVETRVVMNTPGKRNGIIQSWLNGEQVLDIRNIRFRDVSSFAVDALKFETFFGGGDSSWAPSRDVSVFFDDIIISTAPITH